MIEKFLDVFFLGEKEAGRGLPDLDPEEGFQHPIYLILNSEASLEMVV
jgi:hypothetical protein